MRLVPLTYRAKRIRGKLVWVNVYALANVGRAAGAVVVAGAAVSMLGSGVARATVTPCDSGTGTISTALGPQNWSSPADCTITSTGAVTFNNTNTNGTHTAMAVTAPNVGTLSNSGTILNSLNTATASVAQAIGLANSGSVTAILNNAGGLIAGNYAGSMTGSNNQFTITGLANLSQAGTLGTIGTLVNNGIISASNVGTLATSQLSITSPGVTFRALYNAGVIGTLTNNSTIVGTVGGNFTPNGTYYPSGVAIENGDGASIGNLTNSTGALIRASNTGIDSRGNIGTLTNSGTINGGLNGVFLGASGSIGYFNNTGTILGSINTATTAIGVWNRGTIGTLVNSGLINDRTAIYIAGSGSIGTLTNQGTIMGGLSSGINTAGTIQVLNNTIGGLISTTAANVTALYNHGQIGTLTNSGTITGGYTALLNYYLGTIGTLTNSGLISSTGNGEPVYNDWGSIGTLSNSGTIAGNVGGIYNYQGQITFLANTSTGTISAAGTAGVGIYNFTNGVIGTLSNAGLISAGSEGIYNSNTIGTLSNTGSINGTLNGIENAHVITSFDNALTGVLSANDNAAFKNDSGATIPGFSNEGLISGGTAGVNNAGLISQLTNSGTITATRTGQYAAINNSGTIGTLTNSGTVVYNYYAGIINNGGTIGTLSNSGTIQALHSVIYNTGNSTIDELDNLAGGTIGSTSGTGITNEAGSSIANIHNLGLVAGSTGGLSNHGSIGTLTNSGAIYGGVFGIYLASTGTIGSIANTSSGSISAFLTGIYNNGGSIGTLTNQGLLQATIVAIQNTGFIDTLDNSGTITNHGGPSSAIENNGILLNLINESTGAIQSGQVGVINGAYLGTLTNQGLLQAGDVGVQNNGYIDTLDNSGLITSSGGNTPAINNASLINNLTNEATGTIQAAWTAVNVTGSIGTLSNAGLIRSTGGYSAVLVQGGGTIGVLSNSGTLTGWDPFGINPGGAVGTIVNTGTGAIASSPSSQWAMFNAGTIGSLTNNGTISFVNAGATGRAALYNVEGGVIGALTNNGTITSNAYGIGNFGSTIGSLDNSSTGTIIATGTTATLPGEFGPEAFPSAAVYDNSTGTIGTFTNEGLISGPVNAISNDGYIGTLSNSGTVSAGTNNAVGNTGTIASLSNSGLISGVYGVYSTGSIGTINNAAGATISGASMGLYNSGAISAVTNAGVITGLSVGLSNDGTIASILNSGTISDNIDAGLENTGTITSLVNQGLISGGSHGLANQGGYIGSLSNSGTILGVEQTALYTSGTIGTLTNSGVISGAGPAVFVDSGGAINSLVNSGSIGSSGTGNGINNSGLITTLVNSGSISGGYAVSNAGIIASLNNQAGATIIGTAIGLNNSGTISGITNAGVITGQGVGLANSGTIDSIVSTGTISDSVSAGLLNSGTITSLMNQGVISGGLRGLANQNGYIGSLDNSGTIIGTEATGLRTSGTIGSLTNTGLISGAAVALSNAGSIGTINSAAGATISGASYGLKNSGYVGSLSNSGTLVASEGTGLYTSGTIATLTNSGAISGAGAALFVDSGGAIGALMNSGTISGATAIGVASTGSLGTVTNSGTIAGKINNLSANDLSFVGGSGSTFGVFTGSSGGLGVADEGLINSAGSNVVFLGGNILLNDNINVGTNTVTNSAILQVNNPLSITGNYHQTSAANLVLGVTGATNYGNLSVSGTATIDPNGNVSLTRLNGFSFAAGQSFTVVLAPNATYNVNTMNVAVSGYNGSATVTQLQRGPESELVICLGGGSSVCSSSSSSGSSGGGSSGGGSSGGGSSGGGSSGGGSSGGGSSGGGSSGGGSSGGGTTGGGSSGGGSSGGGTTGGGSSGGGSSGGGTTGGGSSGGGSSGGGTTGGGSSGGGSSGGGTTGGGSSGGGSSGGGTTGGGSTGSGSGSGSTSSTTPNHYSMATTANAVAANDAIVGYTGNNEALINLANQVVTLGSAAAANNAGNQLRADSHGPSSQLALQPAMDVLNVVTAHSDETNLAMRDSPSGVAAGENAAGWAPWSEVLGTTGHQSNDGQFAGYGLSTEGILFGADKTLTDAIRVGGLGSYTHASLTDHGDLVGDGTGLDNYGLFGYGTYVGPRAYFDVSAGVMLDRFNTTRVVNIGDFHGAAFGSHNGLQEIAKVEGGYPFALNSQKTTTFSPLWGLAVMHLHQSAYDETGGSAAALAVGSSETWSVKGEIGGKLEHSIKAAGATWVPELRVLWRHEFDRSATSQRESFLEDETGSTEFTTEGPRPEANTGLLEAGVTVLTHGDVSLALRYQADVGSGYFDQGGRLRLRWDF